MATKSVLGRDPFSSFAHGASPARSPARSAAVTSETPPAPPEPAPATRSAPEPSRRVRELQIETEASSRGSRKPAPPTRARSEPANPYARLEKRLERALADAAPEVARGAERVAREARDRIGRRDVGDRSEDLDRRIDELLAAAETGVHGIAETGGISGEAMTQVSLVRRLLELASGVRELSSLSTLRGLWREVTSREPSLDGDGVPNLDRAFAARVEPLLDFLYTSYWRVEVEGLEHVPARGAAMLVANHAGLLPYDGLMIARAVHTAHPAHREVRFLVDDTAFDFPVLGPLTARLGGLRASHVNAERVLGAGELVCAFPEGVSGMTKSYRARYRLKEFGRGGFVSVAVRNRAALIPTAVVGSEEIHPIVTRLDWLGKLIGLPALPVTPTLPLLGPLGLIPLPSKWRIHFGEPLPTSKLKAKDADDYLLVNRLKDQLRATIQRELDSTREAHRSRFFG